MRIRCLRLAFLVLLVTAAVPRVLAQSAKPLGIVDFLSLPRLGDPQLSPDGRDILYTRSEADWKSGRRLTHFGACASAAASRSS